MNPRRLHWSFLGRVPYAPTVALQERLRKGVRDGRGPEHLLLVEHPPIFTLGRNASPDDVVAPDEWLRRHGVEVHRASRGGRVTYHGPGQLVGYPIIDLNPDRRDVRRYVHDLQEVLILTLAELGIAGRRREGQAFIGVWAGDEKVASIGVHLAHWITIHGFALNVATDLSHFSGIVACGLPEVRMASIERLTGRAPALGEVAARVAEHFGRTFARELVPVAADSLTLSRQGDE
ncbi:MAG: lipoyl(octanoyl) transferase LipB [bacterium]|nr:lipoyl(octanoyl) transferase LipB [bacterium]